MTTVAGTETYACPTCGEHVHATVYGSMNSWSYPGSEIAGGGRLVNGAFGGERCDLLCSLEHSFTSDAAEFIRGERFAEDPLPTMWRRLSRLLGLSRI